MSRIINDYIWGKIVPRAVATVADRRGVHGYLADGVGITMPRISPTEKLSVLIRSNTAFILDAEWSRLLAAYLTKKKHITQFLKEKFEARDWESLKRHEQYKFMFTVQQNSNQYATGNAQLVEEGKGIKKKLAEAASATKQEDITAQA